MIRSRKLQPTWMLIALATTLFAAVPAIAQPKSDWAISLGIFPTSFNTSAVLSADDGSSSDVDLENDLGLRSRLQNVRLEGFYRFRPRHRVEFGYTSWKRSGEKSITEQIKWRDRIYDVGATLGVKNNAQFIKLAYAYSFMHNDRTEWSASAGFDTIWNNTSVEGTGKITGPGGTLQTGVYETEANYIAPVPVFGVNVSHLATPKVLVRGSAEYFQASIKSITGSVFDMRGSVDYLFTDTWSAGLGYNFVEYKAEKNQFDANYNFSGPLLYLSYRR